MAQINFGLLDPNQPAKIAAAPFDAYQNTLANMQQLEAGKRQMRLADLGIQAKEQELADAGNNRALAAENLAFDRQNKLVARAKQLTDIQKFYAGKVFAQPSEAAAMAALNEYARLTNDDVTEQVNYIRSLGGNAEQIKAWAQGYLEPQTVQKEKPSALGQLIAERDSLPPNDPRRKLYDQQITKATTHAPPVSVSYGSPVAGVDAQGNPVFFQPSKGGGAPSVIPGVRPPESNKPMTVEEANAAGYADRMQSAEEQLKKLGSNAQQKNVAATAASVVPLVGSTAERVLMSPEQQQARQLQEDWVRSKLRKESGAVIADEEMEREIRTYFPQIGDSPQVMKQKEDARRIATNALVRAAGSKYKRYDAPERQGQGSKGDWKAAGYATEASAVADAMNALKRGADKAAVIQRLESMGITNHGIK